MVSWILFPGEMEKTVYGDQVKAAVQTPSCSASKITGKCQNIENRSKQKHLSCLLSVCLFFNEFFVEDETIQ